jgi:predicted enzyme related to lactoylglutathione lyase
MKSDVMRLTVYYFEIPVNDLERAITFYSAVFGCEFDRVDVDGNQMANFPSLEGVSGASGALAKGDSYIPGTQGIRVYFDTESIDETLAKAVAAGGKVLYPKTSISELGWVAEFEDSEGNCIALSPTLSG